MDIPTHEVSPPPALAGGAGLALPLQKASAASARPRQGYTAGKISGLGMNEAELKKNSVLTDYAVQDLNRQPVLPYPVRCGGWPRGLVVVVGRRGRALGFSFTHMQLS